MKMKLISLAWFVVTMLVLVLLLLLDISRQREQLQLESRVIYEFAYERTLINEVILHNFVELVETDSTNTQAITRFSRELREHYPHIHRLQIYQRVEQDQLEQHQRLMRQRGFNGYQVYKSNSEPSVNEASNSPLYPVMFVEPMNEYGQKLMGLDGYSIAANQQALIRASYYLSVFATEPYPLESGEMGFRLMHAVDPAFTKSAETELIIGLVLSTDELLPPLPHIEKGVSVRLFDSGVELIKRQHPVMEGGWLLPVLKERREINRFGQSSELVVEKQLFWADMHWPFGLVVMTFSIFSYLVSMQGLRRRQQAEAEILSFNEQLRDERDQLEQRVLDRTKELVARNTELRQQAKENRNLTQKVLDIQETERRNIARELHDEMGQALTAIRTDARLLKQAVDTDQSSSVYSAACSIDTTALRIYGVTYGLMRALRPSALDDLGLVDALKQCIDSMNLGGQGIELHLQLSGALNEVPEAIAMQCYRIIQEGLTNSVKYSGASHLWLTVRLVVESASDVGIPDTVSVLPGDASGVALIDPAELVDGQTCQLLIQIEDDGVGFDPTQRSDGFGLIGMRERALANEGAFMVTSEPGKGTRIEASLPITVLNQTVD
ncbi:MAG: CHASE domain-containing protein [Motiliproteus sp.]